MQAGEDLLEVLAVHCPRGLALAPIDLASKMGLAITSRRLLVFKADGSMTLSAKELLSAVPLADVDSVEVGKGMLTKPITLTVRGEAFQVEAPKAANTKEFVAAYERARAPALRRRASARGPRSTPRPPARPAAARARACA